MKGESGCQQIKIKHMSYLIYNNKGGIGKNDITANIANIMGTVFHKKVL